MKKDNKEKITKNLEFTTKKIDTILNSSLVIAIFMIYDGIKYIINPSKGIISLTKGIGLSVFLASTIILITDIINKKKEVKDYAFIISIIIFSVIIYFFPKVFSNSIRIILAIFIILDALINIFNIKKLDKLSESLTNQENKIKDRFNKDGKTKDFNKGVVIRKVDRVLNPLDNLIEKANQNIRLYLILNNISIVLGVLLLFNNSITILVCGIALVYTGVVDLLIYIRSVRLSNKKKKSN